MATAKKKSVFETLSTIDVTSYVEKKEDLTIYRGQLHGVCLKSITLSQRELYTSTTIQGLNFFYRWTDSIRQGGCRL